MRNIYIFAKKFYLIYIPAGDYPVCISYEIVYMYATLSRFLIRFTFIFVEEKEEGRALRVKRFAEVTIRWARSCVVFPLENTIVLLFSIRGYSIYESVKRANREPLSVSRKCGNFRFLIYTSRIAKKDTHSLEESTILLLRARACVGFCFTYIARMCERWDEKF